MLCAVWHDALFLTFRSPIRWDGVDFYSKNRGEPGAERGKVDVNAVRIIRVMVRFNGYIAVGADGVLHSGDRFFTRVRGNLR